MNIALWIVTAYLSLGFLAGGIGLLVLSRERYAALHRSQRWAEDLPRPFLKVMGILKVAAAAGLTLPALTGIAPWLVPLAALGLMMFMSGAVTIRAVRREWFAMTGDLVFIGLAAFVAWGRSFGVETFLG